MDQKIEDFAGYQLSVVSHFIHNQHNRYLADYGVTRAQAKALYLLAKHGDLAQSDLQKRLYIQASTMNGIVESLLKNMLIKKDASEADRRTKVISLTNKGKKLEKDLANEIKRVEKQLLSGFSEEEKNVLINWLKLMKQNLQVMTDDASSQDVKKEGNTYETK
ncbi:MarR family transcriptional regulator [Salipaludibacillus agaradhaerens]|jgi:DNA-binding MarR family transcriptional regulator|uniref:MarR family winged helix-turn-helix transcriptional regulator n=1 Tax=Salipaludibacillus agaradhaerens TaxID=76935 RepID=UPI0021516799|nr:MarR family transcriptional regulator [Salipaludibacillus agaradhaerens]MCR6105286.1 MarR family transcriptional regulator [Salipaludibacillus agaradhaerens]MCR6109363.1 MarR family transcriptional regulator [Bacillus sp. A301a_S52]MCR6117327.1 MarR family transcriptional regulator [Salipaludibacillus agaradhaerens]UJW56530.1 MarR family transcriptional regulator [Bacillus sp. A116_S68]